tara:strand:- start:3437 stop:4777 length:1341 start_codon:yes stop_codon:yes gene_type:complete
MADIEDTKSKLELESESESPIFPKLESLESPSCPVELNSDDEFAERPAPPFIYKKHPRPKYRICLNMIVKNESKVIERLINTVKDMIDYYIISDTGSTDDTIAKIKRTMKRHNIPGEVHQDPWKNFGYNRQRALEYVYKNPNCKYAMIIDADEQLKIGNKLSTLKKFKRDYSTKYDDHCYHIKRKYMNNEYYLPFLLDTTRIVWHWKGPVHNYIDIKEYYGIANHVHIDDNLIYIHVNYHEGAKSAGVSSHEKYMRDVKLLTEELSENPNDTRSWFYLAQSYYDAKEYEEALDAYTKRADMGGWNEEVYYSLYRVGCCKILLDAPYDEILYSLLHAYEFYPERAEALYELCKYCREKKLYNQGYLFGKMAMNLVPQKKFLFIHRQIYDYALADQFALCAYYTGRYQESKDVIMKILKSQKYPEGYDERLKVNLKFALNKLIETTKN